MELSDCECIYSGIGMDDTEKVKSMLLSSLSPLQRKIFQMSAFDDIEYEDIAVRLNISVDAVRMNMCRARKKMRELYKRL